jgi:hypothetical protein
VDEVYVIRLVDYEESTVLGVYTSPQQVEAALRTFLQHQAQQPFPSLYLAQWLWCVTQVALDRPCETQHPEYSATTAQLAASGFAALWRSREPPVPSSASALLCDMPGGPLRGGDDDSG